MTHRPHLIVAACLFGGVVCAASAPHAPQAVSLDDAIAAAVVARMGPSARVEVRSVGRAGATAPFQRLTIDPAARLGTPISITLLNGPSASVRVSADLRITVPHARAVRPIERGQVLEGADVAAVTDAVIGLPMKALPTAAALVGARAVRPINPGEIVQNGFVARRQAVRAGDLVTAVARIEGAEVSARFTAADAGDIGDVIRIVNPDSRRTLRGRVVEIGKVEVVNVR